ncbi:MAG: two-component regulator propeller domain-containing protein, partial [Ignavibacteriaceae bacterium]
VVSSIVGSNKNILWVGYAGGGFDKINLATNKIVQYKHDNNNHNSLSVNDVISLYKDKKGNIWIGTVYGGLNQFDPVTERFISYKNKREDPNSIKSNWVQQILETSNGQLLIGTNDGLQILDQHNEKFYNYSPVIKNNSEKLPDILSINALFEDREKNIWIGTWLDGLFRYDQQKQFLYHYIPDFNNPYSLSASKVTSVYEDSKGFIWVGTHSGGLNKFDKSSQKFYHYTTRNGLPNDVVFGMLEDNNGSIWISTMKGLVKFNPTKETFRIYDQSDGIIHNQFNWHASYKDESGKMYFGGQNGFIKFDPNTITIDSTQIQISFTSFKVFDKEATLPQSLPTTKEIILRYDQNFFSIEFAALDLAPAHKHNYSYMLEGIDPEWINAGSRTTAYYTDIEYGKYKFLVKASNADNIWSAPEVILIIIKPAWWMTWWFKVIIVFAIAFIGFGIYKYRINQILKIERIRYNIASDLHDEIGSNLSSICVDGQLLLKSNLLSDNERELSSDISKTASQTLDAMRDIIWFINPKNDEGEDIIFKMRETASKLLVGMEWSFNADDGVRFDSFSLEQRRNLFLIYKEALTNVIRHSNSPKCEVDINNQADKLVISIKDNGAGFDVNSVRKNTGLLSMMKRAEKINGRLQIESEEGIGTKVSLYVKNKN